MDVISLLIIIALVVIIIFLFIDSKRVRQKLIEAHESKHLSTDSPLPSPPRPKQSDLPKAVAAVQQDTEHLKEIERLKNVETSLQEEVSQQRDDLKKLKQQLYDVKQDNVRLKEAKKSIEETPKVSDSDVVFNLRQEIGDLKVQIYELEQANQKLKSSVKKKSLDTNTSSDDATSEPKTESVVTTAEPSEPKKVVSKAKDPEPSESTPPISDTELHDLKEKLEAEAKDKFERLYTGKIKDLEHEISNLEDSIKQTKRKEQKAQRRANNNDKAYKITQRQLDVLNDRLAHYESLMQQATAALAKFESQNQIPDDQEAPSDDQGALADDHDALTDDHDALTDDQETLTDDQETLTDDQETLIDDQETLADDQETLIDNQGALPQGQEALTDDQEAPTDDQEALTDDQEAPTDNQGALTDDQEALTNDQEAPTDNQETLIDNQGALPDNQEAPADNQETLTDDHDALIDDQEAPADNQETLADDQETLIDNQEALPQGQEEIFDVKVLPNNSEEEISEVNAKPLGPTSAVQTLSFSKSSGAIETTNPLLQSLDPDANTLSDDEFDAFLSDFPNDAPHQSAMTISDLNQELSEQELGNTNGTDVSWIASNEEKSDESE